MKAKLFFSALFNFRNLAVLFISIFAVNLVGREGVFYWDVARYALPAAAYFFFVFRDLFSKKFHEQFIRKEKIKRVQNLNMLCLKLSYEARRHAGGDYLKRLRQVMDDKTEIVNSFFRGESNYVKETIVEKTLNLVIAYIKLLNNFCIRSRELSEINLNQVTDRLSANLRKLNFTKDPGMINDLKNLIAMDEKITERIKMEKNDLEKIDTKLSYMESMVSMFKHQVLSSIEPDEMLNKVEDVVNEAAALDAVLEERRRDRIRA